MKVKELREILDNCNEEADVLICYSAYKKNSDKYQCFFTPIETIGYNQYLKNNKIIVDEDKLLFWGEE